MKNRITVLLLTIALLLSTLSGLTGCGVNSNDEWLIAEEDFKNAMVVNVSLTRGNEGNVTLTATNKEDIFKSDLKDSYFYVVPVVDTADEETEPTAETSAEATVSKPLTADALSAKAIKNVTYKRVDGKTLTFSFTDTTENVVAYTVYIHKNAISKGNYGLGLGTDVNEAYSAVASASVAETFTTATVNPTITVKLENAVTASGLTKDMITLGNAFANLTITNVTGAGGTVTISTSGKIVVENNCA